MGFHLEPPIIWLILLVVFVVIEIVTMGLTTIWFAGGAVAAFLVSLANAGIYIQVIIFLIVSFVLLLLVRPITRKHFNVERVRTNAQTLIGETAVVMEPIDNLKAQGRVIVKGQEWAARNINEGELLEKDTCVRVISISGVKLMVEKISEQ